MRGRQRERERERESERETQREREKLMERQVANFKNNPLYCNFCLLTCMVPYSSQTISVPSEASMTGILSSAYRFS